MLQTYHMAKIITIAHQKGGVGKSTLALNLAYAFTDHVSTAVVDLDPQGTILRLKPIIQNIQILSAPGTVDDLKDLPYDVVFVDTPPYLVQDLQKLFQLSHFVLVPTKVGYADVMAIDATIQIINQSKLINSDLKAGIVLNMLKPRTALTDEVKTQLEKYYLPLLPSISDRVSYTRSLVSGGVLKGDDQKAIEEISALTNEILNIF